MNPTSEQLLKYGRRLDDARDELYAIRRGANGALSGAVTDALARVLVDLHEASSHLDSQLGAQLRKERRP